MGQQGLHHKPLTCANVANSKISECMGQKNLKIKMTPAFHSSVPAALLFSPCIPHRHSYTDNPANEGAATPRGGCRYKTWKLQISKWRPLVIWDWFLFFFSFYFVATWAFELEMHLIKAEELPGGTVLQQRTVQIREELRKCTFLERIK